MEYSGETIYNSTTKENPKTDITPIVHFLLHQVFTCGSNSLLLSWFCEVVTIYKRYSKDVIINK
jgi:hypothetical protein